MKKICAFFIFLLLAVGSMGFDPNPSFHADTIGIFPILENGRVKPLETFAIDVLLQFSGKRYFQNQTAVE